MGVAVMGEMPDFVRQYLNNERMLSDKWLDFFEVAYDTAAHAITFPVTFANGLRVLRYRSLLSYNPEKRKETHNVARKMWWQERPSDAPETPPYPSWGDWRDPDTEFICAGEFDAMCAIAHGMLVTSGTLGEGTFAPQWAKELVGQTRTLLYDYDQSGLVGVNGGWVKPKDSAKPYWKDGAGEILTAAGCKVLVASWPGEVKVGWDVTDHFRSGGTADELRAIIAGATPWKRPDDRPRDREFEDRKLAALNPSRMTPSDFGRSLESDYDEFEIPGTANLIAPVIRGRTLVVAE